MIDIFGTRTKAALADAQKALLEVQTSIEQDVQELKDRQTATEQNVQGLQDQQATTASTVVDLQTQQHGIDARLARLERERTETADQIAVLQETVDDLRDSAIRGEVASGVKSTDVAKKFGLSPARIAQIAPRRRYNNG